MENIVVLNGKKYLVTFTEIREDDELISITEASVVYGVKPTKIYNMIRLKQFPEGVVVKNKGTATKLNRKLLSDFMTHK